MQDLTDLTTQCIRCGFCLESCPTFVITGKETESPRGRIYLARSAEEGKIGWEDARPHISACLGCRACETACPSGVKYGEIFEIARDRLEQSREHRTKKIFLKGMTNPRFLRAQLKLGAVLPGRRIPALLSKLLSGERPEADRPRAQSQPQFPPLDESILPPVKGEVYMLEGCVMRVLYPQVHAATRRLLRRVGYSVRETEQGCCGALHAHNGYLEEAGERAAKLVAAMPDDLPVIVNSAGCGSVMKEVGGIGSRESEIGNRAEGDRPATGREPEAEVFAEFAGRVFDASEFLLENGLVRALQESLGLETTVTYHDACHLSHGQGIRTQPRELLAAIPKITLVPLNEAEMCCGSAGIYNLLQPQLARELIERKMANIEATGASIVVTGNPGCHAWIAQCAREHGGAVRVMHTLELLEASLSGLKPFAQGPVV